jgi:hypothetical protein
VGLSGPFILFFDFKTTKESSQKMSTEGTVSIQVSTREWLTPPLVLPKLMKIWWILQGVPKPFSSALGCPLIFVVQNGIKIYQNGSTYIKMAFTGASLHGDPFLKLLILLIFDCWCFRGTMTPASALILTTGFDAQRSERSFASPFNFAPPASDRHIWCCSVFWPFLLL